MYIASCTKWFKWKENEKMRIIILFCLLFLNMIGPYMHIIILLHILLQNNGNIILIKSSGNCLKQNVENGTSNKIKMTTYTYLQIFVNGIIYCMYNIKFSNLYIKTSWRLS